MNSMHFLDGEAYDTIGTGISLRNSVELGQNCFFVCLLCDAQLENDDQNVVPSFHGLFDFTNTSKFKQNLSSYKVPA